jgi:hypothetical protein
MEWVGYNDIVKKYNKGLMRIIYLYGTELEITKKYVKDGIKPHHVYDKDEVDRLWELYKEKKQFGAFLNYYKNLEATRKIVKNEKFI